MTRFSRTELLIGTKGIEKLASSKVVVFGVGGVGSYAVEALARAGIGHLVLIDNDVITESNINRQIEALSSTVGRYKIDVLRERVLDINPQAVVTVHRSFAASDNLSLFLDENCSYLVDALDTVSTKIALIENAKKNNLPIVSSMGTGNRINPLCITIADLSETIGCPLARIVRRELRKKGLLKGVKVVYSTEIPIIKNTKQEGIGSISFVPAMAGLYLASCVISDLLLELPD